MLKADTSGKKGKLEKVRCSQCGHISWWSRQHPYICAECGSKHGMIINLKREALRERRLEIQRKALAGRGG